MAIFNLVSSVAGFIKVRFLIDKAVIDNMVFRFHYRITTAILFVCSILCTANSLIGDPINCIADNSLPGHVINTYCWITSTFTLPHQQGKPVGTHVAHPGVGTYVEGENETRYHSYYQWIPFMLFFQGLLFYIPHWIWKNWEEGKVRMISDGMRGSMIGSKDDRRDRQGRLVQYMLDTLHLHNTYAAGYFLCEALNFINVVGNIFFVDVFLGGAFLKYGTDVVRYSGLNQENRTDPMIVVFPRVTKCTFHKFGPSGSIQKHDALCVLALNVLNEKIYIFLWFWFIFLSVLSGLALLYSTVIVVLPSIRETILKRRFRFGTPTGVSAVVDKTQVGDFLLLHLLGQNMNMVVFGEILDELSRRLNDYMHNNVPTAPSTLEMSPIYPSKEKFPKETEA
ncbi:innexin inx3 [Zootermopsis nevadensis]|uniref:innexin inx3 n=1 Tax=Zootermopsis nevadensis TaxID=136037 RepID=UPI000B8EBEE1|nr:innexin inx3 [Zootermopsis nevadensis]XP_021925140.1 innexin inx3 [Zootermopsis nevadensis]XP_021925142.1 innexin inx3 [Zootermopsis nevadensis]XP_021925143.1 innexin inx3 [Zootermopsis nevadensis]XP_021925144.1 innexin inx3 [Zootermopsis nevadensis]